MAEKLKRIERSHYKELRNNRKRRDEVSKKLQEWKEKTCDLPGVNCWPDQLQEFSGEIWRDDCTFHVLPNGARIRLTGTMDRLPREHVDKAREYRKKMQDIDDKFIKKLENYADIYGTYVDLIDAGRGTIETHEVAAKVAAKPSKSKKSGAEKLNPDEEAGPEEE